MSEVENLKYKSIINSNVKDKYLTEIKQENINSDHRDNPNYGKQNIKYEKKKNRI